MDEKASKWVKNAKTLHKKSRESDLVSEQRRSILLFQPKAQEIHNFKPAKRVYHKDKQTHWNALSQKGRMKNCSQCQIKR